MSAATILIAVFERVIEMSWQASIIVTLIFITQWIIGSHLQPRIRLAMWGLLLARLILPTLPESRASLFNLFANHPHQNERLIDNARNAPIIIFGTISPPANKPFAPSIVPTSSVHDWHEPFAWIWLTGFIFLMSWQIIATAIFSGRLRSARVVNDPFVIETLDRCCRRIAIKRMPIILETDAVNVPSTFGLFRPRILLPMGLNLSSQQMQFVLIHELAHIRRKDIAILWIVRIFSALHWFNPLSWIVAMKIRAEQELACDAQVMSMTERGQWNDYGRLLVDMLSRVVAPSSPGSIGIVGGRRAIRRRIAAIAQPVTPRWYISLFAILLIFVIGCTTLCGANQNTTAPTADSNEIVTQVYDVTDVIHYMDFTAPNFGTSDGGQFVPVNRSPTATQELTNTIEQQVDPHSWKDRGGSIGSISADKFLFTITQTQANQQEIMRLLTQLHQRKFPQIQISSQFISGTSVFRALQHESGRWNDDRGAAIWSQVLSDNQVNRIVELSKDDKTTTLTAPRITLFNGQRSYVAVATETSYVADFVQKPDGKVDPVVQIVQSGVVLDCRPMVSKDGQTITLDFRPKLSRLIALKNVPWPKTPAKQIIQVPTVSITSCDQSFTIANSQTVALRLVPKITTPGEAATDDSPILVLVRAKIIQTAEEADSTTRP
jgi:beta-lactamase regulating signal transducer with metallopeptidase domain